MNPLKPKIHINRTLKTWFISYMAIIIVMTVVFGFTYKNIEKTFMDETNAYAQEFIQKQKQSIDRVISSLAHICVTSSLDPAVLETAKKFKDMSSLNSYELFAFRENFIKSKINYALPDNQISEYFIYFHNPDFIIATSTGNTSENYFNGHYANADISFSEWKSLLLKPYAGQFFCIKNKADSLSPQLVLYLYSIYDSDMKTLLATVGIEIPKEMLMGLSSNSADELYIINDDNTLFLSSTNENVADEIMSAVRQTGENKNVIYNLANKKILLQNSSDEYNWNYVYVAAKRVFMKNLVHAQTVMTCSIIISLLLGLILVYIVSIYNHKPIDNLLKNIVKNKKNLTPHEDNDDIQYIQTVITKTLEENQTLKQRTAIKDHYLVSVALMKIMQNENADNLPAEELLDSIDIKFDYNNFVLTMYYIEDLSDMFFDDKNDDSNQNFALAKLILFNILRDLLGKNYYLIEVETDGVFGILINYAETEKVSCIISAINQAQGLASSHFNFDFIGIVSNEHHGIHQLSQCYKEAMDCLEYIFINTGSIITYSDIDKPANVRYYYPTDEEERLLNCFRTGNVDHCQALLNQIIEKNLSASTNSIEMMKCLMYDLVGTLAKFLSESGESGKNNFIEQFDVFERIAKCTTIYSMKNEIINIFHRFCEINLMDNDKTNILVEKAKQFIDENYTNPTLSGILISEQIGISSCYLSSIFKKYMRIGVLDYINQIRIARAKTLLLEVNLTLDDIAKMVGYTNVRTFSRVFANKVGVSPGKYRTQN